MWQLFNSWRNREKTGKKSTMIGKQPNVELKWQQESRVLGWGEEAAAQTDGKTGRGEVGVADGVEKHWGAEQELTQETNKNKDF